MQVFIDLLKLQPEDSFDDLIGKLVLALEHIFGYFFNYRSVNITLVFAWTRIDGGPSFVSSESWVR